MSGEILWTPNPNSLEKTNIYRFMGYVNGQMGLALRDYSELYEWSITKRDDFWRLLIQFSTIRYEGDLNNVREGDEMPGVKWFPNLELNFAENLLRVNSDKTAIISATEKGIASRTSFNELRLKVKAVAIWLKTRGVRKGDRVCGYVSNTTESVIAMLAATSIGAIWSSSSSDFGVQGVLDRFTQIAPKVLFVTDSYQYNGKMVDCSEKIRSIAQNINSLTDLVLITDEEPDFENYTGGADVNCHYFPDLLISTPDEISTFEKFGFSHPVYIMYSSGTTGKPKCIVHGAGGTLLQHYKEHTLHTDLTSGDVIFYYTTCGWMMWNWLVSSLHTGATIVLFDGNPFFPSPGLLWRICEEAGITVFGTSPRYLSGLEKLGYHPAKKHDLSRLRCVLSTGSPLSPENFKWVYENIKSDIQLSSISGGTDIISCFMLGAPVLPVRSGYIQCRGLGMAVSALDENGESVINQAGELVCTKPAPSMPVYFWDDAGNDKYRKSYFDKYPGIWRHGDFISINEEGEIIVYGRSDATLNPGGVRIGTSEIYRVVENIPEIADSLVVGRNKDNDVQVVLFVVLQVGAVLNEKLIATLKNEIKAKASPRHVPGAIVAVSDIPRTLNGKKVELAVSRILNGMGIDNKEALLNPESLDIFYELKDSF
ncbi:MAG: acetoacetate--CoA ligase [Ignavibacteriaceae bacterium]|nr:acetoacetate--CoA ligase [Ignavibacteriaceae bacterium]